MIYCAPYILPVEAEPLLDGAILVEQDQIADIGPRQRICSAYPSQAIKEFPQHILMPGFVNCHAHLELSALHNKIPAGLAFTDWLRMVIKLRYGWKEQEVNASIKQGIARLIATGTTCVGDISSSGSSKNILEKAGLRGIVFLEALGFQSSQAQLVLDQLQLKLAALSDGKSLVQAGVAPHAPYSVSPALFRQIGNMGCACSDNTYRLSVHLGESKEEELFLTDGSGPLRQILEEIGKWDDSWHVPACSPVRYLESLNMLSCNLLAVHLNCLQSEDHSILAKKQAHVVTCPASNAWLRHQNSHLQALHRHGVNLALGTDSLASNDDLSMFCEMRALMKDNPWLTFAKTLEIATMGGARALGLQDRIGSLVPGKQADMIAVNAPLYMDINKMVQYAVQEVDRVEMIMVAGNLSILEGE